MSTFYKSYGYKVIITYIKSSHENISIIEHLTYNSVSIGLNLINSLEIAIKKLNLKCHDNIVVGYYIEPINNINVDIPDMLELTPIMPKEKDDES